MNLTFAESADTECISLCQCVNSVCARVRSWTTRGFFCNQAAQPLRLQEQETRHKDTLSSGRVWPEHRTTRALSETEREKERRRRDAGSWRFSFAAHYHLGKEKGEERRERGERFKRVRREIMKWSWKVYNFYIKIGIWKKQIIEVCRSIYMDWNVCFCCS